MRGKLEVLLSKSQRLLAFLELQAEVKQGYHGQVVRLQRCAADAKHMCQLPVLPCQLLLQVVLSTTILPHDRQRCAHGVGFYMTPVARRRWEGHRRQ